MDLTYNEKRLLLALKDKRVNANPAELAQILQTTQGAVVQFAHLLESRGLVEQKEIREKNYVLTDEGLICEEKGLPERRIIEALHGKVPIAELSKDPLAKIAIGWIKKKDWAIFQDGAIERKEVITVGDDESYLTLLKNGSVPYSPVIKDLIKRGLVREEESIQYSITILPAGEKEIESGIDLTEETGTLTRDMIISGSWRSCTLRHYDINKLPKQIFPGKIHPYQRLINEMREALLEMGFTEIAGEIVQSAFWNFDALFQPQDHPAREMQDTFYLDETAPLPQGYEKVQNVHENGGNSGSTGWGGVWSKEKAQQCVLRTHTTSLSIQHLQAHPIPPVKAFCISRVYRREAIDPTHTPEFEQLEGIVMDKGLNFRNLLGFLKEFYKRMGFQDMRFRPAYFPYTEPSVEPEVYVEGLGWVELGGAGIFRREVTLPFGIEAPVLAWGLGVSRVAMLKLGLSDLRMLYKSDIDWIRKSPSNKGGN